MNYLNQNTILYLLLLGFIVVFGIASSEDYNQEVTESIPVEVYDTIKAELGQGCSNSDIVTEYNANKEYYDKHFMAWDK